MKLEAGPPMVEPRLEARSFCWQEKRMVSAGGAGGRRGRRGSLHLPSSRLHTSAADVLAPASASRALPSPTAWQGMRQQEPTTRGGVPQWGYPVGRRSSDIRISILQVEKMSSINQGWGTESRGGGGSELLSSGVGGR
eukprot:767245-Hanusia_phi.AAC.4